MLVPSLLRCLAIVLLVVPVLSLLLCVPTNRSFSDALILDTVFAMKWPGRLVRWACFKDARGALGV